jgi:hypothetical protein
MFKNTIISRFAVSGVAAGVALTASAAFAEVAQSRSAGQEGSPTGASAGIGDGVTLAAYKHGEHGHSDAGGQTPTPSLRNGWVGLGDSRPSATPSQLKSQHSGSTPPKRADAGYVPRFGAGINPSNLDARWSYDFKTPVDTTPITQHASFAYPPIHSVAPGQLGPVDNQAFVLKKDNRTAAGPRKETTVSNPKWNLTTTDVDAPGGQRLYRFDMVCPDHAGHMQNMSDTSHMSKGEHPEVYTGYSDFNLSKGHQVFSYHWGDPAFNNGFIFAHYLGYGMSNTPPNPHGHF